MKEIRGFSPRLLAVIILVLMLMIFIPKVQAQTTNITNLQYSRQATSPVTVTFTVGYLDIGGSSLAFDIRDKNTSKLVKGSGTSSPDPCQSTAGTQYANSAICWTSPPPTSSGTEHASFTLIFDTTQDYSLRIEVWMYGTSGNAVLGSQSYWDFPIPVTAQTVSTTQTPNTQSTSSTGGYDTTMFIFASTDPKKNHFMDLEVRYSSPDTVSAGDVVPVEVSMTYLQNNNAIFPWVELTNTTVSLRQAPKGDDLFWSTDSSIVKLVPGQQYTHTFSINAPQEVAQYLVILHWTTHTPAASAYGYSLNELHYVWDVGGKPNVNYGTYGNAPTVTITPMTTSATTSLSTSTPVTTTSSSQTPSFSLSLDNPLILGILAIVVVGAVLAFYLMRRKRPQITAPSVPEPVSPPPPPPRVTEVPPSRPPAARGSKYCVHCGATIPEVVTFCTKCGKKQE